MKAVLSLLPLTLLLGCGQAPEPTGTITGRVDALTLGWVSSVEAVGGAELATSGIDAKRNFTIQVYVGQTYQLQLVDSAQTRRELVIFRDGLDQITVATGTPVDIGAITASRDTSTPTADPDPDDHSGPRDGTCEPVTGEYRFTTYNLDVLVGD